MRTLTLAGAALAALALAAPAAADHGGRHERTLGAFAQTNLVTDASDGDLVNPWGLAFGPTTPAWVADNGTDVSTLYSGGVNGSPATKLGLRVTIPGGAPTGAVYNGNSAAFIVKSGTSSGSARFLFASEAGVISGWSAAVPPPAPSMQAQVGATVPGAIFKGLAIADTPTGPQLYATDFHNGVVDVFDQAFAPVSTPGGFHDPAIPRGFAPFGIQAVGNTIFVTYAKQDEEAEDDVAGPGNGFVDAFDTAGNLLRRFAARGPLNSPWGIAFAPQGFGAASGALLIGNFGDGRVNAYSPFSARFLGALGDGRGQPLAIDGLWALQFGNGVIGSQQTLVFTAGPGEEKHGILGELTPTRR
jgi:uncharacterized protein (TIGR03118 family)